jgi:hypothetical protein
MFKDNLMSDYTSKPAHKFTFGLWAVSSICRDPFGDPVRDAKSPVELVRFLAVVGTWGVIFHDNNFVSIDATPSKLESESAKLAAPGLDPEQVTQITYELYRLYCDQPIQFYSCFISYNSKDQKFAQRLHDDLQNSGVRFWFAP